MSQFTLNRCALGTLLALTLVFMSACGTNGRSAGSTPAKTVTAQASAAAQAPAARVHAAATPRPPVIRAGRTIRSFSGTGNRAIGSLSEKHATVLQWSTSAPRFQLFTAEGFLLLDSHTQAGRLRLGPGEYSRLHVASPARWTLLLRESA
ncbi:MAG: hypothetical protein JO363_19660 [Solirubrobacterales bacterium]|nr:hypothetical protein [Solirubrobacterales bacterium]